MLMSATCEYAVTENYVDSNELTGVVEVAE